MELPVPGTVLALLLVSVRLFREGPTKLQEENPLERYDLPVPLTSTAMEVMGSYQFSGVVR